MQSHPWDLRSDTSRETGERRRRQRILSSLSSLTSCSSKMASICCARLQIWIAKSIVLIPLCRGPERGCKYCYATTGQDQGEKLSQRRRKFLATTHEPCHVEPLRMRESASPRRSGGLSHRRPSCNATRMPCQDSASRSLVPVARIAPPPSDALRLSLTKRAL